MIPNPPPQAHFSLESSPSFRLTRRWTRLHGKLKLLIRPVRGFKTLKTAYATIKGFEVMRALRKGQAGAFALQDGIVGEARTVERAFGVGPCASTEAMVLLRTVWPAHKRKANTVPSLATSPLRQVCNRAPERPHNDPPTDSLTTLAQAVRDAALRRFEALRPHIQDGVALTEAATGRGRSGVQSSLGTHGHRRVTHTNQAPEFPARFRRVRADTPGPSVKKRQGSMNDGRRLFRMEPCNGGSRSIDRPPDLPDMPRRFTRDNNDCGTARRALIPRPRTGFRSTESIPC